MATADRDCCEDPSGCKAPVAGFVVTPGGEGTPQGLALCELHLASFGQAIAASAAHAASGPLGPAELAELATALRQQLANLEGDAANDMTATQHRLEGALAVLEVLSGADPDAVLAGLLAEHDAAH